MTHQPNWATMPNAAKLTTVRTLATDGQSGADIAHTLATTRNAVLGFAYRNRIKIGGIVGQAQPRPVAPRPTRPRHAWLAMQVLPPVADETWVPFRAPVALLDLPAQCCKWPVHGGSCGAHAGRHSYCAAHRAVAFIPATIGESAYSLALVAANSRVPTVALDEVLPFVRAEEHKKVGAE